MPAVMEKTVSVDRALAQRAEVKLHQYGWSFDDVVNRALVSVILVEGDPNAAFVAQTPRKGRRVPGGLKGTLRISPDFDATSDEVVGLFEHSSL